MRRWGVAGTALLCLALGGCSAEIGSGVGDDDVATDAGGGPPDAAQNAPDARPVPDAAPPDAQPCVGGDDQTQDEETGACYILSLQRSSWVDARTACGAFSGADLVRIDSQAENDLVFDLAAPHVDLTECDPEVDVCDFWVGGNDRDTEDTWIWLDDADAVIDNPPDGVETPLFSQWRAGEPNDADGEDCMIIEGDNLAREWDDRGCAAQYPIICERGP